MKIAELFVALGFDVKGEQKLVTVEQNLGKAQGRALALLAGVTALNVAFYAMIASATGAAVALGKFAVSTDLSSEELQKWQHEAATFNVSGEEVRATLDGINKAQADIKLGQGNIAPFQFFGLSVQQSAFDVLKRFSEVSRGLDPAIARTMASQMGITENMFQFLRQGNLDLERFNKNLILTQAEQANLRKLNTVWQDIGFSLGALKNRFAQTFAEPLTRAAKIIKEVVDGLARFVDWLGKGTPAANALRWALFGIVVALGVAFVGLTALVTVLGALTAALKVAALGALPFLAALLPIVVVIGLMAGALVALILLIEDFWGAIDGKESLFDWNENLILSIKNVERLANAITWVADNWKKLAVIAGVINPGLGLGMLMSEKNLQSSLGRTGGITTNTSNEISVNVQASGNARDIGREVGKSVKQAVIDTSGQYAPVSF